MDGNYNTPVNLKQHIYAEVFEEIIRGEYHDIGIINEKMLIEKFNVSKSPVREALIELCKEGVLRSIPRYGYEILRISEHDVTEIRNYRILLECGSLDKYWNMITEKDRKELEAYQSAYQDKKEYGALEHWKRNSGFHLLLASYSQNNYIYKNLESALLVLSRAYAQFHWDKGQKTVFSSTASTHDMMLVCIKNNDKAKALEYLENDICTFENDRYCYPSSY